MSQPTRSSSATTQKPGHTNLSLRAMSSYITQHSRKGKMNKTRRHIPIPAKDVRRLLRDINLLVVSFDRLGSAFHDDPQRLAIETDKFLSEVNAFKMLARMRRVLTDAYESGLTKKEILRL